MSWAHALMCILMALIPSSLHPCRLLISVIELKWPHGVTQDKWRHSPSIQRLITPHSPFRSTRLSVFRGRSPRLCIWWCRCRSHAEQTCCWTGRGAGATAPLSRHSCPDRWLLAYGKYPSNIWKRGQAELCLPSSGARLSVTPCLQSLLQKWNIRKRSNTWLCKSQARQKTSNIKPASRWLYLKRWVDL